MKTIYYISTLRLPTEKAYGVNMIKTCEALGKQQIKVKLITPHFQHLDPETVYDYYGVEQTFTVTLFPFVDLVSYMLSFNLKLWKWQITSRPIFSWRLINLAFLLDQLMLALSFWVFFCFHSRRSVIYTRSALTGFGLKLLGYRVYYDMHGFPHRLQWLWRLALRLFNGLTVTNHWKADRCMQFLGLKQGKILVAPNGFDAEAYERPLNRLQVRQELVSNINKPLALYTGHLYDWKGAHVFAAAAQHLPDVYCVFIGGSDEDCKDFRQRFASANVIILGKRPHYRIADYLRSADVLVQPNPGVAKEKRLSHFATYDTSPIKLFEYMASGVPLVATDLPSTGEILNQYNSILVRPNNVESLVSGIKQVFNNPPLARRLSLQAQNDVKKYSWSIRAQNVLQFIFK